MIEFEKYMICQYCNLILDNPYESKCCGKLFCLKCKDSIETENCMKCYKIQEFRQNCFVKRLLNQMTLNCFFKCGQKLHSSNLRQHMTYCENREYRCHFCDEDYYYGLVKTNNKTNFIGKKKDFLLHLIENHGEKIIDFHEKIPKDEKFRYFNNRQNLKCFNDSIKFQDENGENNIPINNKYDSNFNDFNYDKKEHDENYSSLVKEEEKETSLIEISQKSKPLLERSDHFYAFMDKMKMFDLPAEKNKNQNKKNSNLISTNSESNNINSNLNYSVNTNNKENKFTINNFLSLEIKKDKNKDSFLETSNKSNLANNLSTRKYDYIKDFEYEKELLLKNYNENTNTFREIMEKQITLNLDNKYHEMDSADSPEIYKTLKFKINHDKNNNSLLKDNIEEQNSFSKLFLEDSIDEEEEEIKQREKKLQKLYDEMQNYNFTKDDDDKIKIREINDSYYTQKNAK